MKKHIHRFVKFSKTIGKNPKVEIGKTVEIPIPIRRKEYKKAGYQVIDIFKMAALGIIWIILGGAVITAMDTIKPEQNLHALNCSTTQRA